MILNILCNSDNGLSPAKELAAFVLQGGTRINSFGKQVRLWTPNVFNRKLGLVVFSPSSL
jgi:hypothetical protein